MAIEIRSFEEQDTEAVIRLWTKAGLVVPWNDPKKDIERKLTVQRDLFLVAEESDNIVGAVMAGFDGHRGWLNYLAVDPGCRNRGIGKRLVLSAESRLREIGCPKINLQVRSTNAGVIAFYGKIGFKEEALVSMGKRLESDESF